MIGKPAPDFTLLDHAGKPRKLSDFRGGTVVLYFYPKDNTPGCTAQACSFRDDFPEFEQLNATILGVSTDSVESHRKFRKLFSLPFTLLSDPDHEVAEKYGVWKEKSMFGNKYWGVERSTFVIAPDGSMAGEMRNVRVRGHAGRVRRLLEELN